MYTISNFPIMKATDAYFEDTTMKICILQELVMLLLFCERKSLPYLLYTSYGMIASFTTF